MALKIRALVPTANNAAAHWRITRPYTMLRQNGIDADWGWIDDKDDPTDNIEDAVVVLQRVLYKDDTIDEWMTRLRKLGAKTIVYEMDDDIISNAYIAYMNACGRMTQESFAKIDGETSRQLQAMRACDGVTVTTPRLAKIVETFTDKPVHVVPNYIDVEWFTQRLVAANVSGYITIGWAGGLRPEIDLKHMATAWGNIAKKYPQTMFVVAGWQPDIIYKNVPLDRIVRVPWAEIEHYPRGMQVDIGCAPLSWTVFNECKSPIKLLEYGLAGAAVVASPTVYGDVLKVGLTGYLAMDSMQWETTISTLIDNTRRRDELSIRLQRQIHDEYNLANHWDSWVQAYTDIIKSKSRVLA